jgi:chromosomal replication initiator protein
VTTNVRALEGALIRVVALGSLERRALDANLASDVLARQGFATRADTPIDIPRIQAVACAHFGVEHSALLSRSRAANVAWARQAAMYLARELTDHSLPQIGREFANRDHTTVLHACRRVAHEISSNARALADVEALTTKLSS